MLLGLGQVEWTGSADESLIVTAWTTLTVLDLSHNSITNIDESVVSPTIKCTFCYVGEASKRPMWWPYESRSKLPH